MRKIIFLVLLALFFESCSKPEEVGKTVIIAENLIIPSDKVYLTTMEKSAIVLDSAEVFDGSFRFDFAEEVDPFKACIAYRNLDGKTSMVYFKNNDRDSVDSFTYSEFFIVEQGTTRLEGRESSDKQHVFASVIDGEENRLIFNSDYKTLGYVDNSDEETYDETLASVKKSVGNFPYSYLLMKAVYANRGNYKKQDVEYILNKVKPEIRKSAHGYNLGIYLKKLPDNYNPLEAFPLLNKEGGYVTDYDRRKKLNMLVLTSTWSHPSTLLLYYMDLEKHNFERDDLYIVDIGADEVADWWLEYKVAKGGDFIWDQLYISPERRQIFLGLYACHGFPLVVFTDQEGKEVKRFWDETYTNIKDYKYDSKNLEEIKNFIKKYLDDGVIPRNTHTYF